MTEKCQFDFLRPYVEGIKVTKLSFIDISRNNL